MNEEEKQLNDQLISLIFQSLRLIKHQSTNSHTGFGNLTVLQIQALHYIRMQEKVQIGDLAEQFNIVMSTATALVDRLVKTKLVARVRDRNDRRVVFVSLTTEGKKLLELAMKQRKKYMESVFTKLSVNDKKDLFRIISKIVRE